MKKLLIVSLFVLGGCASPQSVNYTLAPVAEKLPTITPTSLTSTRSISYKLERVTVPPQTDDLSLVVRDGSDRLLVLTYDRWTVPLSDEVTQALALALTDEMGMPPVQAGSSAAVKLPHNDIQVEVRRFEMLPGQSANLSASWFIKFSHAAKGGLKRTSNTSHSTVPSSAPKAVTVRKVAKVASLVISELTCFATFTHPAQPGVLPLVQAQQKNIQKLSQKIAQTLQTGRGVKGVVCQ